MAAKKRSRKKANKKKAGRVPRAQAPTSKALRSYSITFSSDDEYQHVKAWLEANDLTASACARILLDRIVGIVKEVDVDESRQVSVSLTEEDRRRAKAGAAQATVVGAPTWLRFMLSAAAAGETASGIRVLGEHLKQAAEIGEQLKKARSGDGT